ncbi:protein of unknown function [uncultured Woeseiaceae bacterium]|uniref:Uncharacterized protein n=1 Tax=uncultured Woeseiaceae bacterium TaxID=1983305 RepID=A0A7D9D2V8_9GAMM|nr:protein of unknown function [uncultured Woeseiaceae bacterium]
MLVLLRRITEHMKSQNWFAVALDFVVVVVGIFMAFQIERWYGDQLRQDSLQARLLELSEDFAENEAVLIRSIDARREGFAAAEFLLKADEMEADNLTPNAFYKALAETSQTLTPRIRRGAYDILISTGEIEFIEDESLKTDLVGYYTDFGEFLVFNQSVWLLDRNTFEPYVARNLDHVALLQFLHTDRYSQIARTHDADEFRDVLGTTEFEGMVAAKSHATGDEISRLSRLLGRNSDIRARLSRLFY